MKTPRPGHEVRCSDEANPDELDERAACVKTPCAGVTSSIIASKPNDVTGRGASRTPSARACLPRAA